MSERRRSTVFSFMVLGIAAVLGLGAAFAEESESRFREASVSVQKGLEQLRKGQVDAAETLFTKALGLVATFPDAHLGLGHVALQRKDFQRAELEYQKAIDEYPKVGDRLFDIRMTRFRDAQNEIREMRDQLIALSNPSVKISNPDQQRIQIEQAILKLQLIKMPERDKTAEVPGEYYFYLGNAVFYQQKLEPAIVAWESCAEKSPDFSLVRNNLAVAYLRHGEPAKAKASLDRAASLGLTINPQLRADIERALANH